MTRRLGRLFAGLLIAAGIIFYNNRQIEERVNAECQARHLALQVGRLTKKEEVAKNVRRRENEFWAEPVLSADAVQRLFDINIF